MFTSGDKDESDRKHFNRNKKYPKEKLEKYKKWIEYEYIKNRFDKWNHNTYLQVFEWSFNNNIPANMRTKAQSLTIAYMTYLATNGGERSIPKIIKTNFINFYKKANKNL